MRLSILFAKNVAYVRRRERSDEETAREDMQSIFKSATKKISQADVKRAKILKILVFASFYDIFLLKLPFFESG